MKKHIVLLISLTLIIFCASIYADGNCPDTYSPSFQGIQTKDAPNPWIAGPSEITCTLTAPSSSDTNIKIGYMQLPQSQSLPAYVTYVAPTGNRINLPSPGPTQYKLFTSFSISKGQSKTIKFIYFYHTLDSKVLAAAGATDDTYEICTKQTPGIPFYFNFTCTITKQNGYTQVF